METTNEELVERTTTEELERQFIGRILHMEPGGDNCIAGVDYFPVSAFLLLTFKDGRGQCTVMMDDAKKLIDGEEIVHDIGIPRQEPLKWKLLPVDEMAKEEPTEQPAKPRLTEQWRKRWWQFYYRYITADDTTSAENAASMADEAIKTAMKHLEG